MKKLALIQNARYYAKRSVRLTTVCGFVLVMGSQALADVVGRLHFAVKNAADEKPIAGAKITLKDSANVKPPITLTSDKDGNVTTDPIDARSWHITSEADTFQLDTRDVTVVADTTTDVELLLEPLKEKVIRVTGDKNVTRPTQSETSTARDQSFTNKFPTNPSNRQSLTQFLRTTPGLLQDSAGQLHPRGEHSSTTIYINGFQLPGAFQGRNGQVLSPTAIQNIDVMTGGYSPEYGRETAAVLNVNLRAGTIKPFATYSLLAGGYQTAEGGFTLGGQLGKAYGAADDAGAHAKRFGYLIDFDARSTANAIEPPQPDNQTAHNHAQSYTTFGNFDYKLSSKDSLSLLTSFNPANNQVANRTGLPSSFAAFGQGYGFGGAQGPESGLGTQQQDGQDIFSRDHNEFGVLNYLRQVDSKSELRMSFGLIHSGLDTLNHSPSIDLANLPADNSIEYNPTVTRNSRNAQLQGSLTRSQGTHTFKLGFTIDRETSDDSYSLDPASQAALNNLLSGDPTNSTPDPTNPLWLLRPNGNSPATVTVSRKGWYRAAYIQDTWRITHKLVANYGFRFDDFETDQTTQRDAEDPIAGRVSLKMVSPRLNLAYMLSPKTVLRASYNRLMITPPGAQGASVGTVVEPEKLNQFETSIEHQTGRGQSAKISAYYKDIRDQLDTGLLIPGSQIGVFVTDSIPEDSVRGYELSYNLFPTQPFGFDGFVSYQNATAKPTNQPGVYNDHDQLNTVSMGVNYTFRRGGQVGAEFNYGSGFASSAFPGETTRHPHSQVNLRFAKANLFRSIGLSVDVENVFDHRDVFNFDSAFSGTRFQQGRRFLVSLTGKF